MCGIFFYLGKYYTLSQLMTEFMKSSHRGPDSSFLRTIEGFDDSMKAFMGFHRLAIMDMSREGDQPFESSNKNYVICNGEIYNHKVIRDKLRVKISSHSDCSVILPLYEKFGISKMMKYLDGDFAFIILDTKNRKVHLARDPVGVKPLFYLHNSNGFFVSSEMKSLIEFAQVPEDKIIMLSSGTTLTYDLETQTITTKNYWSINNDSSNPKGEEEIKGDIREKLTLAVKKRLMTDRPLGLLISGGLDSSLIAGITRKLLGPSAQIESFSIGMPSSPDVEKAKIVASYLKTKHHTVDFTAERGIAAIREVIKQLETFDITTIRASVPQYLLSKYISENTEVKVILSGEGSDELFGGYMYSHLAPSNEELQKDSHRLIKELEMFDVLRTDRTTAGNGLEVRVPFLDRGFMRYVLNLDGKYKNPNESSGFGKRIEKAILRDAFNTEEDQYIPDEILYRTKNAFSDACGYDWIPTLQTHFETSVTNEEFSSRFEKYPHMTPSSKEAYYYRKTFEEFYPNQSHILKHYWLPNWVASNNEPSARLLNLIEK
jgi:asparagine synthase (glutamine-hydrolysing)